MRRSKSRNGLGNTMQARITTHPRVNFSRDHKMEQFLAGEFIEPLAHYAGWTSLAALAALHGARRGTYMSSSRKRSGPTFHPQLRSAKMPKRYHPRVLFRGAQSRTSAARPSKYRSQLGRAVQKFKSRRHTYFASTNTSVADKTLRWIRLIQIPWSEDETVINRRRSNLVNVKGVRVRFQFALRALADSELAFSDPVSVRWAIINPKNNTGITKQNDQPNDFFISRDPSEEMAAPFNTTQNFFTYQKSPINRMEYGVVQEGRFILRKGDLNVDGGRTMKSSQIVETYLRVNKQMKFDNNNTSTGSEYPEQNLYFVYWYTKYNTTNTTGVEYDGTANKSIPLVQKHELTTYFTNASLYK